MPENEPVARPHVYAGLFLMAMATLMFEVLLTRIFSVTMHYHYAFFAISLAMFGLTAGALCVYLAPGRFPNGRVESQLALSALGFAALAVAAFWLHLHIRFYPAIPWKNACSLTSVYIVISIPFISSGIFMTLALTRFPRQTGRLYAADLAGAAVGCLGVIAALAVFDGPTAIVIAALLAALAALVCARRGSRRLILLSLAGCILLALLAMGSAAPIFPGGSFLRLIWVKGVREGPMLYEKWNSFSRVTVRGNPEVENPVFTWGLSPSFGKAPLGRQLDLTIDAGAGTNIAHFDGDLEKLHFLKYDIVNLAHHLRPDSRLLVIGAGGGRDVLTGLVFHQPSITAVEINPAVLNAVNNAFGDFSGHLDKRPEVRFALDEARSYIARQKDRYDIMQVSFIDTWAATAAGAFTLTENSLYTVEAFTSFLRHLSDRGILTVSRWRFAFQPAEMYRLTALACASLRAMGVADPGRNILVLGHDRRAGNGGEDYIDVGTILVSPSPFSDGDLDKIRGLAQEMRFELSYSPRGAADPFCASIVAASDLDAFARSYPLDISPPHDNRPYFFNMLRLSDAGKKGITNMGNASLNLKAIFILAVALATVITLSLLCLVIPPFIATGREGRRGSGLYVVYFLAIGFGFMLVEIAQIQRLIIFLGHPIYGLCVALFTLLLAGGAGSFCVPALSPPELRRAGAWRFMALLAILVISLSLTPALIGRFAPASTPVRIAVAVALLAPMGWGMGMAFPLGMQAASAKAAALTPWLWGLNGAASVTASVVAVAISMSRGISFTLWAGVACYACAFAAFLAVSRRARKADSQPEAGRASLPVAAGAP